VSGRPRGFTLAALLLGLFVLQQAGALMDEPAEPSFPAAVKLLATVLSAVAAEALWTVRPWATRACGALALLGLAAFLWSAIAGHEGAGAIPGALVFALLLVAVLRYVDSHVQAIHGPTVILQVRRRVRAPWARWRP
jgi:peptidoglycan/LPS O-acetylase OafA/YrhL